MLFGFLIEFYSEIFQFSIDALLIFMKKVDYSALPQYQKYQPQCHI